MGKEMIGITINFNKLDGLKQKYWVVDGVNIWKCKKHNTFFDIDEEPCWYCWSDCEEIL